MYSFHFSYKKKEKRTFTTIISGTLNRTQKVVQIICIKSAITHTSSFT